MLSEFNNKAKDFSSLEDNKNLEIEQLLQTIEETTKENNFLLEENGGLKNKLQESEENISKMNELLENNYQNMELNYKQKIMSKENTAKK